MMCWVKMITCILSAAISNWVVASESVDLMVGMLLSDEVVIGEVVAVHPTSASSRYAEFRVEVSTGSATRVFYLSNPQQEALFKVSDKRRMILISKARNTEYPIESILWSPSIGVYESASITESEVTGKIAAGKRLADRFINEHAKCPTQVARIIRQLNGRHGQRAIDKLYAKKPLLADAFSCLVKALHSTDILANRSFKPPYPSQEAVYHHGFETTGDLVAILLPHLTGIAIYPPIQPLDSEERQRLFFAWAYWGYRNYQ